ncbi:MAG: hypothetical protein K6C94_06090 [Candidatus Gastranaerophilales bacterium]|nr:hypothetical protein [Candidatus Gastranaerophilales bacterium]
MIIGAPCEIKPDERKIALTPALVQTLTSLGHKVVVQKNAGKSAGFYDEDYKKYGAEIAETSADVYSSADIIVKINPPLSDEYDLLKEEQIIFAFFDFSDKNNLMNVITEKKITTISYSKIQNKQGIFPFIKASSEVVGKTVIRIASSIVEKYSGGALLGGTTGVAPLKVTVIGAGTVGLNAAKTAVSIGADVALLDVNPLALRNIEVLPERKIKTYFANQENISKLLPDTDILICAVKKQHKYQPPALTVSDVKLLKKGALIIDTGIVSGNAAVETLDRILPCDNPIYENDGILYYCFPDIASLAAKTISMAISGTLSDYLISAVSYPDIIDALREKRDMISGVLTYNGNITNEVVADIFGETVYELSMLTGF